MNIAFDATAMLGPMSKNRGIGNYALSQFTTMIDNDENNKYFFFNTMEKFDLSALVKSKDRIKESYFYCGKDNFLITNPEYSKIYGDIVKQFIKQNEIDVFYITSPFESSIIRYEKEWFEGVKTVATVYDVIPYVMKERYLTDKITKTWYMGCVENLRWVDRCFVISNSVKIDMVSHLNFDENKIDVIYGAVDERFKKISLESEEKIKLFEKFGIIDKYIMCTGGDDDRKNMQGLIEAYSKLDRNLIDEYQLVIVCKLTEKSVIRYSEVAKNNHVEGRVILTNFVTNEELLQLYNMAYLVAFPSVYEGFGLPIVEAFSCGVPVLTSNNSSLGEIAGDAAILVDPFDLKDITKGLNKALTTNLQNYIESGFQRVENFKWSKVANDTIKFINEKISLNFNDKGEEKLQIAFFTPLPPLQSGIADYSLDILNELAKYFHIDVYIDGGYERECNLDTSITVYNHKKYATNYKKYHQTIYQIGNSEYHIYMFKYINKFKGLIVLHDYNLHGVVQFYTLSKAKDLKAYETILLSDYDKDIVQTYINNIKSGKDTLKLYEYELNGFLINHANKIIVHTDEAREKLLERDVARRVKTIRSYANIEPISNKESAKIGLGIDREKILLASFGHIHNTKRAIPTLKAVNMLSKEFRDIKIVFVGKLDANLENEFKEYVLDNNLEDVVSVTGYTTLEDFNEYINATDICLNLRYPYNGETSGSLMRILAKGKCVLVNDIGSFGEVPDECCVKLSDVSNISSNDEVLNIYSSIKELLENPSLINDYERQARKYAEENLDIKIIGKEYRDFILDNFKPSITEEIINNIAQYEINEQRYNKFEIEALADTLAYAKR